MPALRKRRSKFLKFTQLTTWMPFVFLLSGCAIQVARTQALNPVGQQSAATASASVISAHASARMDHTCALIADGSLRCWGSNSSGENGTGNTSPVLKPTAVNGLGDAIGVGAGAQHTCAIRIGGSVSCWGDNSHGQLGNGTLVSSLAPVAVSGLDGTATDRKATALAAGLYHTCALLGDRTVKCWGDGARGQLGNGATSGSTLPVAVSGLSMVVSVASGAYSSCVTLSVSPWLMCWGDNTYGQLGDGTTANRSTPVTVPGLGGVPRAVAVGADFACSALDRMPWFICWGSNGRGQFGNGDLTGSANPVAAAGSWYASSVSLAAGDQFICARLSTGRVDCWGDNTYGQIGDGHASGGYVASPAHVDGPTNAIQITAGSAHACAILADGTVRCWGNNNEGQLGNGQTSASTSPLGVDLR